MRVITAPTKFDIIDGPQDPMLFLAGGISNCPNWQLDIVVKLDGYDITFFNPRRERFPDDPDEHERQIKWEFEYLEASTIIAFWFTEGDSVPPIALYELGRWMGRYEKRLFIGIHPEYKRRKNIDLQLRLEDPGVRIVYSLDHLAEDIKKWYHGYMQK